jgi:hypothetical protein
MNFERISHFCAPRSKSSTVTAKNSPLSGERDFGLWDKNGKKCATGRHIFYVKRPERLREQLIPPEKSLMKDSKEPEFPENSLILKEPDSEKNLLKCKATVSHVEDDNVGGRVADKVADLDISDHLEDEGGWLQLNRPLEIPQAKITPPQKSSEAAESVPQNSPGASPSGELVLAAVPPALSEGPAEGRLQSGNNSHLNLQEALHHYVYRELLGDDSNESNDSVVPNLGNTGSNVGLIEIILKIGKKFRNWSPQI